jgi:N-acetylmuramoyl-L-alanine amidase
LVAELVRTYGIEPRNVVGHSDVAPARKEDPGELFDWERLARLGLAIQRPSANLVDPGWPDAAFLLALERYGYGIADGRAATVAFQRRFRPAKIDGVIDGECRAILLSLLLAVEGSSVI